MDDAQDNPYLDPSSLPGDDPSADGHEDSLESQAAVAVTPPSELVSRESPEMKALKEVAGVMRKDPAVSTMLDLVRGTPDIFAEVQPILSRRDEFAAAALPGELHRTFAPLFCGIGLSRRARDLLSHAVDRNTEQESSFLWELIRDGQTYVPEVVIGSGVHAAIYNAERMALEPDVPGLTVDVNARIGGQFAQPEAPVWNLNTRTRPETPDAPHVPGNSGSLNTLGGGVLQQSDLSGNAFGSQDSLALATRVNHLLFSKILSETEVVSVGLSPVEEGEPQQYTVTLRRIATGEETTIITDRVIIASGLGEPLNGFEKSDEDTRLLLAEETRRHESGEDARVLSFEQFAERVGEESDPFPLRSFKRVAVIGPGDGGAVAAEYLLGYGPDTRMSVTQLDRVESLVWIGQKAKNRQEYIDGSRQRYRDLALEFPVEGSQEYTHRIYPVQGRAYKLERLEDGNIRIHYGTKQEDGSITPTGTTDVDHIVLATGFKDSTDTICGPIIDGLGEEKEEIVYDDAGNPIARRYTGSQIYKVGPSARLPVSNKDRAASPAMRLGKKIEATPAIWATAEETEALARMLTSQMPAAERPHSLTSVDPTYPVTELPPVEAHDSTAGPLRLSVDAQKVRKLLKPGTISEDITRFAVGSQLHSFRFPADVGGISFTVRRMGSEQDNRCTLDISSDPPVITDPNYKDMILKLFNDELLQSTLIRLTERSVRSSQTVELDIPLEQGKADVNGVEIRVKRR